MLDCSTQKILIVICIIIFTALLFYYIYIKDENLRIKDDIDYSKIGGLSREIVSKLTKIKPTTIGEASRIPGMTPAAITAVLGYLKK